MSDRIYTLTVVRTDGTAHTTTASGHYAESMMDKQFAEACQSTRTLFAVLIEPGGAREGFYLKPANQGGPVI